MSKEIRVAINGFGRIGRLVYRIASENPNVKIVLVNDLAEKESLLYNLRDDSVHGRFLPKKDDVVSFFRERDPERLELGEFGVDVVIEATGMFTTREDLEKHLRAGAKKVILTAPVETSEDEYRYSSRVVDMIEHIG
ncbi:glyceraldehyde 3-phosphate dehydrogenase NAD-binding domain-containing protein [Patescibacteria group bacterium]